MDFYYSICLEIRDKANQPVDELETETEIETPPPDSDYDEF